jgi:hypothetical protein
MTILESFMRGLEFSVFGVFGDTVEFDDERNEKQRFIKIISAGKTYNFPVETDIELQKYKQLKGSVVRVFGSIVRNKNSASVKPVISGFVLSGQSGWKEPSETDVFAGCTVSGYVRIQSKRSGVYSGNEYRKVQVVSFGDVFELNRIEPALFEQLPDTGLILIRCRTEPRLGRTGEGRIAEMDMLLEMFKPVEAAPPASSSVPPTSASSSSRKAS